MDFYGGMDDSKTPGHTQLGNTGSKMNLTAPTVNENCLQYSLSEYAPVYQQHPQQQVKFPPIVQRMSSHASSMVENTSGQVMSSAVLDSSMQQQQQQQHPHLTHAASNPPGTYQQQVGTVPHATMVNGTPDVDRSSCIHSQSSSSIDNSQPFGWQNVNLVSPTSIVPPTIPYGHSAASVPLMHQPTHRGSPVMNHIGPTAGNSPCGSIQPSQQATIPPPSKPTTHNPPAGPHAPMPDIRYPPAQQIQSASLASSQRLPPPHTAGSPPLLTHQAAHQNPQYPSSVQSSPYLYNGSQVVTTMVPSSQTHPQQPGVASSVPIQPPVPPNSLASHTSSIATHPSNFVQYTTPPQHGQGSGSFRPPQVGGYQDKQHSSQGVTYRVPGTAVTTLEWSQIKAPIGLLQENQLWPSDTGDLPPKPNISGSINCNPDVMRCTLTNMPATSKLLSQCRLPLGLVMHPFRDLTTLHTINSSVIVRCRSCRTYINPFVQFIDSGRRWRCTVCFLSNAVPEDFFYDPTTQSYGDPSRRPEIRSATVEFIAPPEYMLRPPQPATYLFCFDVSRNAIATGYLSVACKMIRESLNRIPGDVRRQIGFLTFDSALHFYRLYNGNMKLLICPDLDEPFIPDFEGLINRIENSSEALEEFLLRLPDTFAKTNEVGNCLGSALQVALKMIGGTGGRVTVFNTCLPNIGAGVLQPREEQPHRTVACDGKILGPAIDFYKTFALDCAAQQVTVDFFLLNSQYCDIATLSGAARFSGGCFYHYPDFHIPHLDEASAPKLQQENQPISAVVKCGQPTEGSLPLQLERFKHDLYRYLTRKIGFEAVMRIRCTHGLTIQAFHGSFFVRSTDLMSLPNVNPDAGFAVQLGITENIDQYSYVCCQAAVLYTSAKGDRRIRVHTLSLPVVHNASEVFAGADQGAIACLIAKMAVDRTIESGLTQAREAMSNSVSDSLSAFASVVGLNAHSSISSYSMACPPNLRLLPLYVCGLLRHTAFKMGSAIRLDDRSAALERLKTAPPDDLLTLIYPQLYAVHQFVSKPFSSPNLSLAQKAAALRLSDYGDAQDRGDSDESSSSSSETVDIGYGAEKLPGQLHLSARSVSREGIYLLDTGDMLYLLVGSGNDGASTMDRDKPSDTLQQLLGISSPAELPIGGGPFGLPPFSLDKSTGGMPAGRRRLSGLIKLLRLRRPIGSTLVCMRHDAPATLKTRFLAALIEDRTESSPSYHEFLQMIQSLMTS